MHDSLDSKVAVYRFLLKELPTNSLLALKFACFSSSLFLGIGGSISLLFFLAYTHNDRAVHHALDTNDIKSARVSSGDGGRMDLQVVVFIFFVLAQ